MILMRNVRRTLSILKKNNMLNLSFFFFFFGAVVSITAHEGFIHGFLVAIGRQEIPVPTGGKKFGQFSFENSLTNIKKFLSE